MQPPDPRSVPCEEVVHLGAVKLLRAASGRQVLLHCLTQEAFLVHDEAKLFFNGAGFGYLTATGEQTKWVNACLRSSVWRTAGNLFLVHRCTPQNDTLQRTWMKDRRLMWSRQTVVADMDVYQYLKPLEKTEPAIFVHINTVKSKIVGIPRSYMVDSFSRSMTRLGLRPETHILRSSCSRRLIYGVSFAGMCILACMRSQAAQGCGSVGQSVGVLQSLLRQLLPRTCTLRISAVGLNLQMTDGSFMRDELPSQIRALLPLDAGSNVIEASALISELWVAATAAWFIRDLAEAFGLLLEMHYVIGTVDGGSVSSAPATSAVTPQKIGRQPEPKKITPKKVARCRGWNSRADVECSLRYMQATQVAFAGTAHVSLAADATRIGGYKRTFCAAMNLDNDTTAWLTPVVTSSGMRGGWVQLCVCACVAHRLRLLRATECSQTAH